MPTPKYTYLVCSYQRLHSKVIFNKLLSFTRCLGQAMALKKRCLSFQLIWQLGITCLAGISILEKQIPGLDMCTEQETKRKIYYFKQKSQPKSAPSSCKWHLSSSQYEVPLIADKKRALIHPHLNSNSAFHLHRAFFISFLTLSLSPAHMTAKYLRTLFIHTALFNCDVYSGNQ